LTSIQLSRPEPIRREDRGERRPHDRHRVVPRHRPSPAVRGERGLNIGPILRYSPLQPNDARIASILNITSRRRCISSCAFGKLGTPWGVSHLAPILIG
jgi:hypothetical protein